MQALTLKDIQDISLDILIELDVFCRKKGIEYSLAYGTLIGAARHQGFIPWDDDVDIVMTRENFERFLKEFKSNDKYRLISPYDKKSYIAFARLCEMHQTLIKTRIPWSDYETGVWIDIFPMDSISDNEDEHRYRWKKLNRSWTITSIARGAKANPFNHMNWKKPNYLIWLKKIVFLNGFFVRKAIEKHMLRINNSKYYNTKHVAQLACCDEWGFYDKADFEQYTTLLFEGHELLVIKEYDKVLRQLYGDYMQLPPENQQIPKQSDYIRFYWRAN